MAITFVIIRRRGDSVLPGNPKVLVLRCVIGTLAMFAFFLAVKGLPLSEAVTITHLSPFFVALFAAWFLGERLAKAQIAAIFTAFGGALLVLRPGIIEISVFSLLALVAAVLAGGARTSLRALGETDSPQVIVFWFSASLFVVALPPTLVRGTLPDGWELALLAGIGVGGTLGQLSMTAAYRYAPGGEVAIYTYLGVAFSMLWQVLFWAEPLDPWAVGGAVVIVASAWMNIRAAAKRRARNRARSRAPGGPDRQPK
jgi:drug/metabolite transporter (DMT)-like permease